MDREVKRLCESLEVPDAVYRDLRHRAWTRLQKARRPRGRKLVWAGALAALASGVLLARLAVKQPDMAAPQPMPQLRPDLAQGPAGPAPAGPGARVEASSGGARGAVPARAAPVSTRQRAKGARAVERGPDRLVLNFVLPETGVRLIWIADRKFDIDGGIE